MKKKKLFIATVGLALFAGIFFFSYRWWQERNAPSRAEILALMPADAEAIFYADVSALRNAPFITQLIASAPKLQADAEYAQFIRDTGFDYERDLDHIAVASYKKSQHTKLFAIAAGRFDEKKITAYAQRHGKVIAGAKFKKVFSVPMTDSKTTIFFAFISKNEIVITDDESGVAKLEDISRGGDGKKQWQTRFERLSGSPLFAVIQQDGASGDALAARAPGGLRSPQLSAVLNQLQWISIAGIPAGNAMRIVAECESANDANARELADILNGVILLAQGGLNEPKTRQQLAPDLREAYLELLGSAEVSRIDRNETKSVRILFDLTPKFLEAARLAVPSPPAAPVRTPPSTKSTVRN